MLDWSIYNKKLDLDHKFKIQDFYKNLIGYDRGICYAGGNDSIVIIKTNNFGIKIYKNNEEKTSKLIEFHTIKQRIYPDHNHIQKVFEIKRTQNFTYSLQEWIEGETLLQKVNTKTINIDNFNLILTDLYLNILIPLWSKGLIWVDGCLSNFCLNDKLIMIDTDNMYKTSFEILNNPNVFTDRNKARLKNMQKHTELLYNLVSVIKYIDFNYFSKLFEILNPIYISDIDNHYTNNSIECFQLFLSNINTKLQ